MSCHCHKHHHGVCEHHDLAFCKECNVVYCRECGTEWGQKEYVIQPWPYPQPYWTEPVYPNPWRNPWITWTVSDSSTTGATSVSSQWQTGTANVGGTLTTTG